MTIDLDQLREVPHDLPGIGRPDLAAIRAGGLRRRRRRRLAVGAAALATAAVVGGVGAVGYSALTDTGRPAVIDPATRPTPTELSDIARRTLAEVPGAEQVSEWQVVIPADVPPSQSRAVDGDVVGETVPLGAHAYAGVTIMPRPSMPEWLTDATIAFERTALAAPDGGHPVGSTDSGVYVDYGASELACMAPWSSSTEDMPGDTCYPAVVARVGESAYLQWSMGTERFLEPGHGMELFTLEDLSAGEPRTVWIGGIDGTDVARVEYVTVDGGTVPGTLAIGSLVPEETMFWASVGVPLERVVAYDAAGKVIDEHPITPCSGGVDCEVR